jgi:hypothetical protein
VERGRVQITAFQPFALRVNRKVMKSVKKKSGHFSENRENRFGGVLGQLSERGCR